MIPRLCALGLHPWRLVATTGARVATTALGPRWIANVTRKCDRCGATRHEQHVPAPRWARGRIGVTP